MRVHPVASRHEDLVDLLKNFEVRDASVDFRLALGNADLTHRFSSGKMTCGGSETSWKLDAVITERISNNLRNAPVRLITDVNGITLTSLYARVTLPTAGNNFTTRLLAATPGALLDKVPLGKFTEYDTKTPQWVIRDAAYRVAVYDKNQVIIPEFDTPKIKRSMDKGYEDETKCKTVIDDTVTLVDAIYYDTQLGGLHVMEDPGTGIGKDVAWTYATDSPEVIDFVGLTWATPDEQVTDVVVRKRLDEPHKKGGVGPDHDYQLYYSWPVDYSELDYPPCPGQKMYLPYEYDPDEDDPVEKQNEARQLAFDTAYDLSNGLWSGSIKVVFNHLLEPGDVIMIEEDDEDDDGAYHRIWRCIINSVAWDITETSVTSTFEVTGILQREVRLRPSIAPLRGVSPGNVAAGNASQYFGFDVSGMYIDPDFALPVDGIQWMGVDEDGLWIDDDASGGRAGYDEDGLWIEDGLSI